MREHLDEMKDPVEQMQETHQRRMGLNARRAAYARGWNDRHRARRWRGWGFR